MHVWLVLHEWKGNAALSVWVVAVSTLRTQESLSGSEWYREEGHGAPPKVLLDIHTPGEGLSRAGEPCSISYRVTQDVARLEGGPPETSWAILLYSGPRAPEGRDGASPRHLEPLDFEGGRR